MHSEDALHQLQAWLNKQPDSVESQWALNFIAKAKNDKGSVSFNEIIIAISILSDPLGSIDGLAREFVGSFLAPPLIPTVSGIRAAMRMLRGQGCQVLNVNLQRVVLNALSKCMFPTQHLSFNTGEFNTIPESYFDVGFGKQDELSLPPLDWSKFRGYTFAAWMLLDDAQLQFPKDVLPESQKRHRLFFRFATSSNIGAEAYLWQEYDAIDSKSQKSSSIVIMIRSRSNPESKWESIRRNIDMEPGRWHFVCISHSQPFLRKSKLCCYVDGNLQFEEAMSYPIIQGSATVCSLGKALGGRMAHPALFHGGISKEQSKTLHARSHTFVQFPRYAPLWSSKAEYSSDLLGGERVGRGVTGGLADLADRAGVSGSTQKGTVPGGLAMVFTYDPRTCQGGTLECATDAKQLSSPRASTSGNNVPPKTPDSSPTNKDPDHFAMTNGVVDEITINGRPTERYVEDIVYGVVELAPSTHSQKVGLGNGTRRVAQLLGSCRAVWSRPPNHVFECSGGIIQILMLLPQFLPKSNPLFGLSTATRPKGCIPESTVDQGEVVADVLMMLGDAVYADHVQRVHFCDISGYKMLAYCLENIADEYLTQSVAQACYFLVRASVNTQPVSSKNSNVNGDEFAIDTTPSENPGDVNQRSNYAQAKRVSELLLHEGVRQVLFNMRIWNRASVHVQCQLLSFVAGMVQESPVKFHHILGLRVVLEALFFARSNDTAVNRDDASFRSETEMRNTHLLSIYRTLLTIGDNPSQARDNTSASPLARGRQAVVRQGQKIGGRIATAIFKTSSEQRSASSSSSTTTREQMERRGSHSVSDGANQSVSEKPSPLQPPAMFRHASESQVPEPTEADIMDVFWFIADFPDEDPSVPLLNVILDTLRPLADAAVIGEVTKDRRQCNHVPKSAWYLFDAITRMGGADTLLGVGLDSIGTAKAIREHNHLRQKFKSIIALPSSSNQRIELKASMVQIICTFLTIVHHVPSLGAEPSDTQKQLGILLRYLTGPANGTHMAVPELSQLPDALFEVSNLPAASHDSNPEAKDKTAIPQFCGVRVLHAMVECFLGASSRDNAGITDDPSKVGLALPPLLALVAEVMARSLLPSSYPNALSFMNGLDTIQTCLVRMLVVIKSSSIVKEQIRQQPGWTVFCAPLLSLLGHKEVQAASIDRNSNHGNQIMARLLEIGTLGCRLTKCLFEDGQLQLSETDASVHGSIETLHSLVGAIYSILRVEERHVAHVNTLSSIPVSPDTSNSEAGDIAWSTIGVNRTTRFLGSRSYCSPFLSTNLPTISAALNAKSDAVATAKLHVVLGDLLRSLWSDLPPPSSASAAAAVAGSTIHSSQGSSRSIRRTGSNATLTGAEMDPGGVRSDQGVWWMASSIVLFHQRLLRDGNENCQRLNNLTVGGTITSSSQQSQLSSASKTTYSVRRVVDGRYDTKWVDVGGTNTSGGADHLGSWINYKYPECQMTDQVTTTCGHRLVRYSIVGAMDRKELDPTGWTLLGRKRKCLVHDTNTNEVNQTANTEEEGSSSSGPENSATPWTMLDRRTNVSFLYRGEAKSFWIETTGFFNEYRIVFDPSSKPGSWSLPGSDGRSVPALLHVGEVLLFECDSPSWHRDSNFLATDTHIAPREKEVASVVASDQELVRQALSLIEVIRAQASDLLSPQATNVSRNASGSVGSLNVPWPGGDDVHLAVLFAVVGTICYAFRQPWLEQSLATDLAGLVQAFLQHELKATTPMNRSLVLVILHSLQEAMHVNVHEGSKEVATALALAIISTYKFDDSGGIEEATLSARARKNVLEGANNCFAILSPMIHQALEEVMEMELNLHHFSVTITNALLERLTNPVLVNCFGSSSEHAVGLSIGARSRIRRVMAKHRELVVGDIVEVECHLGRVLEKWTKLLLLDEAAYYEAKQGWDSRDKFMSTTLVESHNEQNASEEEPTRSSLWKLCSHRVEPFSHMRRRVRRNPNGNLHNGASSGLSDRIKRQENARDAQQNDEDLNVENADQTKLVKTNDVQEPTTSNEGESWKHLGVELARQATVGDVNVETHADGESDDDNGDVSNHQSLEKTNVVGQDAHSPKNTEGATTDRSTQEEQETIAFDSYAASEAIDGVEDEDCNDDTQQLGDDSLENRSLDERESSGDSSAIITTTSKGSTPPETEADPLLKMYNEVNKKEKIIAALAPRRKLTLEQWINRMPSKARGELVGPWMTGNEQAFVAARCIMVRPEREIIGRLIVTTKALYFDPDPPNATKLYLEPGQFEGRGMVEHDGEYESSSAERWRGELHGKAAEEATQARVQEEAKRNKRRRRRRWLLTSINRVLLRRYRMQDSAIEVFLNGRVCKSFFLFFPNTISTNPRRRNSAGVKPTSTKSSKTKVDSNGIEGTKQMGQAVRDQVVYKIHQLLPREAQQRTQTPDTEVRHLLREFTVQWQNRAISNFEYLMEINFLAGRSYNDLTQYPVFPWVLSNYTSETIDLNDPANFRDLTKPMGALNPERLEECRERYATFDDPDIPKFHYGSHYSTMAGVVLFFLVRLEPFTSLHIRMQDGHFDVPDRLFSSIPCAWHLCTTSMSEVKEIVPEFYCMADFLRNRNKFDLGTTQDHETIGDVELPPWANHSPEEFVQVNRKALESDYVSNTMHKWLDLIFGYKQRGQEAVLADNVFYYLTYPGAVKMDDIEDPAVRLATELQVAMFGQCPLQIFKRMAHPARGRAPPPPIALNEVTHFPSTTLSNTTKSNSSNDSNTQNVVDTAAASSEENTTGDLKSGDVEFDFITNSDLSGSMYPPAVFAGIEIGGTPLIAIRALDKRLIAVGSNGILYSFLWGMRRVRRNSQDSEGTIDGSEHQNKSPSGSHVAETINFGDANAPALSPLSIVLDTLPIDQLTRVPTGKPVEDSRSTSVTSTKPQPEFQLPAESSLPFFVQAMLEQECQTDLSHYTKHSRDNSSKFPLAWSKDGSIMVSVGTSPGSLEVFGVETTAGAWFSAGASINAHYDRVTALALDKNTLVSASRDCTIKVWNVIGLGSGMGGIRRPGVLSVPQLVLGGHSSPVSALAVNQSMDVVVSAGCDEGTVIVHTLSSGEVVKLWQHRKHQRVELLCILEVSGSVILYVVEQNEENESKYYFTSLALLGPQIKTTLISTGPQLCLTQALRGHGMTTNETLLSGGQDGSVTIWRAHNLEALARYEFGFGPVTSVTLCFSEEVFAAGFHNGSIVLQAFPHLVLEGNHSSIPEIGTVDVGDRLNNVKGAVLSKVDTIRGIAIDARGLASEAIGEVRGAADKLVGSFWGKKLFRTKQGSGSSK